MRFERTPISLNYTEYMRAILRQQYNVNTHGGQQYETLAWSTKANQRPTFRFSQPLLRSTPDDDDGAVESLCRSRLP